MVYLHIHLYFSEFRLLAVSLRRIVCFVKKLALRLKWRLDPEHIYCGTEVPGTQANEQQKSIIK